MGYITEFSTPDVSQVQCYVLLEYCTTPRKCFNFSKLILKYTQVSCFHARISLHARELLTAVTFTH